jgi:transcriptional regulator with XRE-family HTH domain
VGALDRYRNLAKGIAAGLRRVRRAKRLSQATCARLTGVTQPRWSEIERGLSVPLLPTAVLMAAVLGVTIDSLIPADLQLPGRPARRKPRVRSLPRGQAQWLRELARHVPGLWQGQAFHRERLLAELPAHRVLRSGRHRQLWRARLGDLERDGVLIMVRGPGGGWLRLERRRWRPVPGGVGVGSPAASPQPLTT